MHPILFHLGSFPIHSYGALGALAFVVGAAMCLWRARQLGLDVNKFADLIFWMAMSSLVGARLTFVAQNPGTVTSLMDLLDLRGGGLVFYGSFAVGIPVGFTLMSKYDLPRFASWDIFGTAFPLSHAVSRLGCYASGCCYGSPTESTFAVTYPPDSPIAPPGIGVHPVQLYEAAALVGIAVVTNALFSRRAYDGQVFLVYMVLYAITRTVTELWRGDPDRGLFLPELFGDAVSFSQGVSGLFAVVGIGVFLWAARRAAANRALGAQIHGPT
ncbi:MAG: prolipoprotein diacylglyceryl transferase [Myxococcota bacterium]